MLTGGNERVATGIDEVGEGVGPPVILMIDVALLILPTRVHRPAAPWYTVTSVGSAVKAQGMHALWRSSNGPGLYAELE